MKELMERDNIPDNKSLRLQALFNVYGGEKAKKIDLTPKEKGQYDILAAGPFGEEELDVTIVESKNLSPEETTIDEFIQKYVKNLIAQKNNEPTARSQRKIEDWPKLQVSGIHEIDNRCEVVIEKDRMSYGKLLAFRDKGMEAVYQKYTDEMRALKPISFERFKKLFQPAIPNVCCLLFTGDDKILLTKRSPEKVNTYGQAWHVPGGQIEGRDIDKDEKISPFIAIKREIKEETGITADKIDQLVCLGLAQDPNVGNVEFMFIARTSMSSGQIVDKSASSLDQRLLLKPDNIDGDIRPKKIVTSNDKPRKVLAALLKIDDIFGITKKISPSGPELTVPTSRALFFLVDKILKDIT